MTSTPVRGLLAAAMLAACAAASAANIQLRAHLSGAQEVPATGSAASGTAVMMFDTATRQLNWSITFTGLQGSLTAAHFHGPALPGASASPVVTISGAGSPLAGSATLTAPQAADLLRGQYYVNLHSSAFVDGEIRGQVARVRGDFDGDGRADLFWHHAGSGATHLWYMDGVSIKGSAPGFVLADPAWRLERQGDFDGDGNTDALWRHGVSGEVYVWLMNGAGIVSSGTVFVVSDLSWRIAGVGDFDGDGRSDILWRHAATGEVYVWLMNGLSITASGSVFVVADLSWQVAATGDFDGDGKSDVFWRHAGTGDNHVWLMNGLAVGPNGLTFAVPDLNWKVAGTGDADGDGRADVFWRHDATGQNYLWHMAGLGLKSSGLLTDVPDLRWRLLSIADHDGDGRADMVWRHAQSGQTYAWTLDGFALASDAPVFALSDLAWGSTCPTPSCTDIALAVTPSRVSGVAPLAVFFDTEGTAAAGISRPFHDIEYRWNFGDPASGTWTVGARPGQNSRNEAAGALAAHVFDNPGTYNVTVTAFDGKTSATRAVQIVVDDPDVVFAGNKTECISNTTDFTGCPAGATQVPNVTSLITALGRLSGTNQPRRLLFRRGHVFAAGTAHGIVAVDGPGIIGAFGTGNRPRFTGTGSGGGILEISRSSTPNLSDWRFMDLEIDGTGTTSTSAHGISAEGGASRITLLRLALHHMSIGINFNYQTALDGNNMSPNNDGHENWDQIAIVDSDIRQSFDNAGIYLTSRRFALLGTAVEDVQPQTTGHTTRFPSLNKAIISNSTLSHPTLGLQTIKLHSAPWPTVTATTVAGIAELRNVSVNADAYFGVRATGPGLPANTFVDGGSGQTGGTITLTNAATASGTAQFTLRGVLPDYTEQVVISDNKIIGSVDQTRAVNIMPQSASNRDERLRNIVVERNWFITGAGNSHALAVDADNVTVRNNICDGSASSDPICISIMQERPSSLGSGANDVRIYNNTGFSSRSGGSFYMTELESTVTNITIRNNLAYTPSVSDRRMINGTGASGLVSSNNTTNMQTNPNFVGPLTGPAGFRPQAGSYAIGSGIALPGVWSDFFLQPQPDARDLGAVLH